MNKQREEFEAWYKEYKGWMHPEADEMAWKAWQASSIPEGYVVVPKEPPEGIDFKICDMVNHRIDIFEADRIYKAMIEAVKENNE